MKKSLIASGVLLCLAAQYSHAALEAVITSGTRTEHSSISTPANITVISREQIEASGVEQVVDILRGQGAIFVQDSFGDGSRATVSMRGFSGSTANSNILIMVDGRRLNNTDISNPDLNSIAIDDIERIEIVQGSAGVLYGDQAVGGVIHIVTRQPFGTDANLETRIGSYQSSAASVNLNHQLSRDFSYRISAEHRTSDNYRRQNNAIRYSNLFIKGDQQYRGGNVFVEMQTIHEDLELPGSLTLNEVNTDPRQTYISFIDDYTDSETEVIRIGHRHNLTGGLSLETDIARREVKREIQQSFRGLAITTPSDLRRTQLDIMPRLVGRFPMSGRTAVFTVGIDSMMTDFSSEITSSQDEQIMVAVYGQMVIPATDSIDVTIGRRIARVEDDVTSTYTNGVLEEDADAFEIGAVMKFDGSRVFARFDQNFRFAKVDELTFVSPGTQLRPQTGNSIELGWGSEWDDGYTKVTLYQLDLEDEIAFDQTAPQPVGAAFPGANVNFDPTLHRGLIIETGTSFGDLRLDANYSFTQAEFEEGVFKGNDISGVPAHTARLSLSQKIDEHMGLRIDTTYVGEHYLDGDNINIQPRTSSYAVTDANLSYRRQDWSLSLRIANLTDKSYVENANAFGSRFPMPERNIMLTSSWKIR